MKVPKNALLKQHKALLETEGVKIEFTDDAIGEIATMAFMMNEQTENIGARRLHTVIEAVLDDISFNAGDVYPPVEVKIDAEYVKTHMQGYLKEKDLSRFII